jgi:hypothetical protein
MRSRSFLFAVSPLVLAACVSDLPALTTSDASSPIDDASASDAPLAPADDGGKPLEDATVSHPDVNVPDPGEPDAATDAAATCFPRPAGLISFYTGDNETDDRGPAHNDLTWMGSGTPAFAKAMVGKGFLLNNTALQALAPTGLDGLKEFTLEAWVQPARVDGGAQPVDCNLLNRWSTKGWALWLKDWQLRFDMPPAYNTYGSVGKVVLDAFTHIAITFDGTVSKVYVNGVLDQNTRVLPDAGVFPFPGEGDLRIGAQLGARPTYFGIIDELSLYGRALSKQEIQGIFGAGGLGKCR